MRPEGLGLVDKGQGRAILEHVHWARCGSSLRVTLATRSGAGRGNWHGACVCRKKRSSAALGYMAHLVRKGPKSRKFGALARTMVYGAEAPEDGPTSALRPGDSR